MHQQRLRGVKAVDRFWHHVVRRETGCWLFRNNAASYGTMRNDSGKNVQAHRFSYELHHGEIPRGMYVCHKCDVRGCVNPEHLYAGTHEDNNRDAVERRRHRSAAKMADEARQRRLSPYDAENLRKDYAAGFTQQQLAKKYKVSQSTVSATIRKAANQGLRNGEKSHRRHGHFRSKITAEQREEIRQKYATGSFTQTQLAVEYGVTQTRVSDIITGRDYKRSQPQET